MSDEPWMPIGAYVTGLERDPRYLGFMQVIANFNTRRTVTVATRKYKARRRRR